MNAELDKIEIKPLAWRLVFIRLPFIIAIGTLAFLLTFMLASGFRLMSQALLGNLLLFGVLGALMFALTFYVPVFLRSTITITDRDMAGHTGRGWRRCRIPLDKIDIAKSQEQTKSQRIFGDRFICSVDGERICIDGQFFSQEQSQRILAILQAKLKSLQPTANAVE